MKLGGWIVLITVMITFLSLIGFSTSFSPILNSLGIVINDGIVSSVDLESSSFFDYLFNSLTGFFITLALTSAVVAGLYIATKDTNLLALPFIIWIGSLFASSFWTITSTIIDTGSWWMTGIVTIIFGGLMVGFVMSCFDYFLGR